MASIFEREPIFAYDRPWDDETKLPEKFKFSGTSGKAEVHVDSGSLGMEFFYQKTLPDFIQAATKLNWSWAETVSEFENVLDSSYIGLSGAKCKKITLVTLTSLRRTPQETRRPSNLKIGPTAKRAFIEP